jgi:hypothetical protein
MTEHTTQSAAPADAAPDGTAFDGPVADGPASGGPASDISVANGADALLGDDVVRDEV